MWLGFPADVVRKFVLNRGNLQQIKNAKLCYTIFASNEISTEFRFIAKMYKMHHKIFNGSATPIKKPFSRAFKKKSNNTYALLSVSFESWSTLALITSMRIDTFLWTVCQTLYTLIYVWNWNKMSRSTTKPACASSNDSDQPGQPV